LRDGILAGCVLRPVGCETGIVRIAGTEGASRVSAATFRPPAAAFTRGVPIRFSHSDPAGIVYFPHYFDMFNGLIEDWYGEELGVDYSKLILGGHFGFPIVHAECDFRVPSRMGERLELTLIVDRVGRSSLGFVIVGHLGGVERLRARIITAMIALDTGASKPLPEDLRASVEAYRLRSAGR